MDRDPDLVNIEYELTLLSRYHALAQRAELHLDRSAYLLLGRLELQHPMSLKELSCAFLARHLHHQPADRRAEASRAWWSEWRIRTVGSRERSGRRRRGCRNFVLIANIRQPVSEKVLREWTPEQRLALGDLLRQFNTSVEALEGREWPRPNQV